ncbi:hypothetical protein DH2020_005489 [Rehmannia glutinosa]|uniref:Defensin-like protein n=1 Tax=Rehmannia glutinosa TaxID=99300 RepID=A0ABR0XG18_REHGL
MVAVNKSFCILFVLFIATVGEMVQASDMATVLGSELIKRCVAGLGECGARVCDEECCKQKCSKQYGGLSPQGYCGYIGVNQLCYCNYDCS